jgi:hypothetical protein
MKRRHVVASIDAANIQAQIDGCKHKRGRELLERRLLRMYLESYVDLEKNKAVILAVGDYQSERVGEQLHKMVNNCMHDYPSITRVDAYGYEEAIQALKSGKLEWPKSSIIQPEIEGEANQPLQVYINGIEYEKIGRQTKQGADKLISIAEQTAISFKLSPTYATGDREAGEIRMIIETVEEVKKEHEGIDPNTDFEDFLRIRAQRKKNEES